MNEPRFRTGQGDVSACLAEVPMAGIKGGVEISGADRWRAV
jgi:hypothetical protein